MANYANANPNNNDKCIHCTEPIATHAVAIIRSDDATLKLAQKMQAKLDGIYVTAVSKGYQLPPGAIMVGAITATVGSTTVKAVAVSGGNAPTLLSYITNDFGSDVAVIGDNVPIASLRTLLGNNVRTIAQTVETTRMAGNIPAPHYPVGSCAAQKLLNHVVQYAITSKTRINPAKITMAEIFWKSGGKSQWSTGDVVESCNTCKYILPLMLCNYDELGNKVPY